MNSEATTNLIETWENLSLLTVNICGEMANGLQNQKLKLDVFYNNMLRTAQQNLAVNLLDEKTTKNAPQIIPNEKNGENEDLFSAGPSFQPPSVSHVHKSKKQASVVVMDKIIKNVRESSAVSSIAFTRDSQAQELSTFIDTASTDFPRANSTFKVGKKLLKSIEEHVSPQNILPEIKICHKDSNINQTYNKPIKSLALDENFNSEPSIKESIEFLKNNKKREKLEDINVNVEEQFQYRTRTMKRKLQEKNQIVSKKTNVIKVPLKELISTPLKPSDIILTPHQIRENEAEKRKELFLKSKADQRKIEDQHLKAAKKREEQVNLQKEKLKQSADKKIRKEEKQKAQEILLKKELLKKQKQADLRIAEINAKRKQTDEAKLQKLQKAQANQILKENDLNSGNKTPRSKIAISKLPLSSVKNPAILKSKIGNYEIHINDYGLNDISARDSSDDESKPKKAVPYWANRENRKAVLELQYHLNVEERDLFFNCPKSMNFKEMFKGWNIRDKQRTSSAVWNTTPCFN